MDGALALEFEELEAPTRVEPPTDPANAEELAAVAAGMLEAAGWPERLPTEDEAGLIAQDVAALPSAAEVTVEEGTLRIVDQDGAEERLLYWVRPPGDRPAHEDLAQSMAAGWSRTLGEGGVLIVTGQAILSVPAVLTEAFMQDLTAAFEAGSGRDAALDELIGSPSLSASLSDTTVPPELGARFAPQQSYPSMQLVAFQPRSGGSASPPDPLSPTHYDSRTPKSDRAYIVAPVTAEWFQKCAAEGTRLAANLHGYKLYEFWGKAATMEELVAASGRAGIMHVCSHGNVSFGPYSKGGRRCPGRTPGCTRHSRRTTGRALRDVR